MKQQQEPCDLRYEQMPVRHCKQMSFRIRQVHPKKRRRLGQDALHSELMQPPCPNLCSKEANSFPREHEVPLGHNPVLLRSKD